MTINRALVNVLMSVDIICLISLWSSRHLLKGDWNFSKCNPDPKIRLINRNVVIGSTRVLT